MGNVPSDTQTASSSQSEPTINNLPLKRGKAMRLSNSSTDGLDSAAAAAADQRPCKPPPAVPAPAPSAAAAAPKLIGAGRDVGDGVQYGLVLDKMQAHRASRRKHTAAAKLTLYFRGVPPVEAQDKMKSERRSRSSQDLSAAEQEAAVHLFDVAKLVSAFNAVRNILPMLISDDRTRLAGYVEIHLNLVHPISICQSRQADAVPSSASRSSLSPDAGTATGHRGGGSEAGKEVIYLNDMTTKMLVDSRTSTCRVIEGLMEKYRVVDDIANFGLYACEGQCGGPGGRLLRDDEEPLLLVLLWGASPSHSLSLQLRVSSGRQRVDTLIHWDRFTHTELGNFLRMLNQEEQKYVDIIRKNYEMKRKRIEKLILSREESGSAGEPGAASADATAAPAAAAANLPK